MAKDGLYDEIQYVLARCGRCCVLEVWTALVWEKASEKGGDCVSKTGGIQKHRLAEMDCLYGNRMLKAPTKSCCEENVGVSSVGNPGVHG